MQARIETIFFENYLRNVKCKLALGLKYLEPNSGGRKKGK